MFDEQARCNVGDRLTRHLLLSISESDWV
jgi:hypothetical protein